MSSEPDTTFPFLKSLDIPPAWEAAAQKFLETGGVTLVLGGPDTGKSTLCQYLIYRAYAAGDTAALVDLDLGQSHLGPPGALGLGLFPPRLPGDQGLFPEGLYFIGQTSPVGRVLEVAVGCRVLADRARAQGVSRVVVNTSGLISGPAAFRLKQAEAELLQPALILALAREQELAPLLRVLDGVAPTLLLPVSHRAMRRGMEERRQYRQTRFRRYFARARCLDLSLSEVVWQGPPLGWGEPLHSAELRRFSAGLNVPVLYGVAGDSRVTLVIDSPPPPLAAPEAPEGLQLLSRSALEHSLTGLLDASRRTLALAVLLPSPWQEGSVRLWTPLSARRVPQVRYLSLGRVRLTLTGRELPPDAPSL
jgi:polynucleotide 5'-hydroxyl-kinase GRC3/NOL9